MPAPKNDNRTVEENKKVPKGTKKVGAHNLTIGLGFGLLVTLVVLWAIFYYKPMASHIQMVRAQVRRWGGGLQMAAIPQAKITALEQDVAQLESDIASIEKKIYPMKDMPQIGRRIIQLGQRHHLVMIAMTPSYDVLFPANLASVRKKPLVKLPVTFLIRGRYFDIGRFLEDIPKLPFAFAVDEVNMETAPDVYPNVNIQLKGYFFLLTESAKFQEDRKQRQPKKLGSKSQMKL